MSFAPPSNGSVMVTGATGFVGRQVVRRLLACGIKPICVVRSAQKLYSQHDGVDSSRLTAIVGSIGQEAPLQQAADLSQAVIHLVGIIIQRRLRGQTFQRVHVSGTRNVVEAASRAGIKRLIHMSALGVREDAPSAYQRTKRAAEDIVMNGPPEWTILRPSVIHGPGGEFMRLIKRMICGFMPPAIPYFGDGQGKIQPVSVQDVAHCIVEALRAGKAQKQIVPMGGPKTYTWVEFYNTCRRLLPGAKKWKRLTSLPGPVAQTVAALSGPPLAVAELIAPSLGLLRFDRGQVMMAQEDNVCDFRVAERAFGIQMRPFERDLAEYADQIS